MQTGLLPQEKQVVSDGLGSSSPRKRSGHYQTDQVTSLCAPSSEASAWPGTSQGPQIANSISRDQNLTRGALGCRKAGWSKEKSSDPPLDVDECCATPLTGRRQPNKFWLLAEAIDRNRNLTDELRSLAVVLSLYVKTREDLTNSK